MIEVQGYDYTDLYKHVRALQPEVGKELRKTLTKAGNEGREAVRSAALALPSRGGTATKFRKKKGVIAGAGLRQGIAAATETKVNASKVDYFGIRIRVSGSKFASATGKSVKLPRYMEGLSRRPWRHPVFVKRDNLPGPKGSWVSQTKHPYLLPTLSPLKDKTANQVREAFLAACQNIHIFNN